MALAQNLVKICPENKNKEFRIGRKCKGNCRSIHKSRSIYRSKYSIYCLNVICIYQSISSFKVIDKFVWDFVSDNL